MLSGRLFAGRRFTMWRTWEEAKKSFDMTDDELLQRSDTVWWRATTVEVVHPTQEQVKKDL
jgi:hypothetical protein